MINSAYIADLCKKPLKNYSIFPIPYTKILKDNYKYIILIKHMEEIILLNKKLTILSILFVALLAISAVSAAENITDTADASKLTADESASKIKLTDNNDIDNGTFSELQNKIDTAGEGGTVDLKNNYTYDDTFSNSGITIAKPITINGNGFTINALGQSRIFNINALSNVTLKNITFINGRSNLGGAIIFNNAVSNVEIDHCKFINNTATENGGAIYAKGIFTNNTVKNSEFTSNFATKNGGAIYINNESSMNIFENISFSNNKANTADGGAINFHDAMSNSTFKNLVFINNYATNYGGCINTDKNVNDYNNYTNVIFINNTAGKRGGALGGYGYSNYVSFKFCLFANNTANQNGGAISYDRNMQNNTFQYCIFANNTAKINGGSIYNYRNSNYNKYKYVAFTDNTAKNNGGAIYIRGFSESEVFENVVFKDNHALTVDGGSISVLDNLAGTTFNNVSFINNTASNNGGAINVDGDAKYIIFKNTSFINNAAKQGGALSFVNSKINLWQDSEFIQNKATVNGGALIVFKTMHDDKIRNTYFNANTAAGAIIDTENVSYLKVEAIFVDNAADSIVSMNYVNNTFINNTLFLDNAVNSSVILSQAKNVNITNSIFLNKESKNEIKGNGLSVNYNWFGNNATNYDIKPNLTGNITCDSWLFLDAIPTQGKIPLYDSADIIFRLCAYNSTSNETTEYDLLDSIKLEVSVKNGNVDKTSAEFDEHIKFTSTSAGIASITGTLGKAKYTVNIEVEKLQSKITVKSISTVYNVNKYLVITLKDSLGNPIKGVKVAVNLKGSKYYTTDKNGQIKVPTKGLTPKKYTAKITFNEDANYLKSSANAKVVVKKANPKMTAKSKTFKRTTKTKKYTIALKTNLNKALKSVKVTLKVKGKKYIAKTNKKGKATFKITKLTKKGNYKATIVYKGNSLYNKVAKKVKIKCR